MCHRSKRRPRERRPLRGILLATAPTVDQWEISSGSPAKSRDSLVAAIFDMDGVLTLTAHLHQAAWKQLFDELLARISAETQTVHRPFSDVDYRNHVDGRPRYEGVRAFLASRGLSLPAGSASDPLEVDSVLTLGLRKNLVFRELIARHGVEVDEAAVAFARALRAAGVRIGVATSSENASLILQKAGIAHLFEAQVDGMVSGELGLKGKPDPDIFLECARRLRQSAPSRSIVIEDAASGVAAARAGAFGLVIGVDRGGNWLRLREGGADWIVRDMAELSAERMARYWAERADARPNMLRSWQDLATMRAGRPLAVFLDYDGTLTTVIDRPELAQLDPAMRETLDKLKDTWPTFIITGRGLEHIQRLVGIETLWYAASHGYDIASPAGTPGSFKVAPDLEPAIHRAAGELLKATRTMPGVLVEDKGLSIAVHYRRLRVERIPELEYIVDCTLVRYPALKKGHGKMVFQLRPAVDWDKGKALLWLLESNGLDDAFPIYIGDDITDEDAFSALVERGLGVLVTDIPKPTMARYSLQDPFEVRLFLERLIRATEVKQ